MHRVSKRPDICTIWNNLIHFFQTKSTFWLRHDLFAYILPTHLFFWVKLLRLWGITFKVFRLRVFFGRLTLGISYLEKKVKQYLIFMWLSLDLYFWKSIYIGLYFHLKFGILYWNAVLCIVKGIFKKWVGGLRDFYSFNNWEFFTFVLGIHGIGSNFVRLAIYYSGVQ